MRNIINRVATTHIFWAADFHNYADVICTVYDEIPNISNYHHFKATNADKRYNFKYKWYGKNTAQYIIIH
jgi:hypothetical protein